MYECVLCLGNWRKQASKVEILISALQSKLWKGHLRALNHGPHWSEESGIPPENTLHTPCAHFPDSRVDGSSISHSKMDTWRAWLWGCTAYKSSNIVCSHKQNGTNYFCAMLLGPRCVLLSPRLISSQSLLCYLSLEHFFFSYLRDKGDLHFPLNTVIMPLFPPK